MADRQDVTQTLTAVTTGTTRSGVIDLSGKRDIVFSVELSAAASNGSDTLAVIIQHTNTDSSLYGDSSSDNYWETFYTFANVAGNATVPYISHADQSQTLITGGTATNVRRSMGRWARWKYTVTNGSGSASYTGKLRMSYNVAITQ